MTTRRAIVTGASSGIGAATAIRLAGEGYSVWLTFSTSEDAARTVATECEALGSPDVRVSTLDLRSSDSIDALIAEVAATWGDLHVLVNNGGICPYVGFDDIGIEEWDAVMETNARGTFLLSRASLALLRAAAGSDRAIINISSIAGQVGGVTTAMHYAASKGAILAITRTFARHLAGERIRVNAVAPGPITSVITDQLSHADHSSLSDKIPLGRFGTPAEGAWIIASLASPRASFVTGATYDVNGGVRIG